MERASARETAARVAAGMIAKLVMRELGTEIMSHVLSIGQARVPAEAPRPTYSDLENIDANEVRCFYSDATEAMIAEIKAAAKEGD